MQIPNVGAFISVFPRGAFKARPARVLEQVPGRIVPKLKVKAYGISWQIVVRWNSDCSRWEEMS